MGSVTWCLLNPNITLKLRKKLFKEIQRSSCSDRDEFKERKSNCQKKNQTKNQTVPTQRTM